MTAEHRPNLPTMHWPTEVTIDDLATINRMRGEGKSLAASVAQIILDESKQLPFDQVQDSGDRITDIIFRGLGRLEAHFLSGCFRAAAEVVLDAEEAIRGGESIREEMVAEFHGKQVKYTGVEGARSYQPVQEAAYEVRRQQYAAILTEGGPLALVDFYVDSRIDNIKNNPLWRDIRPAKNESSIAAFENGRKRFHQLYAALQ